MTLLDNWVAGVGFFSAIVMVYRMFLSMGNEFSDDEQIVKDPLAYAARTTITFNEFEANSWKAFDVLVTAIRFRTFCRRFRPLIDPRDSKLCALFVLGAFVLLLVVAQIAKADPKVNNVIGGIAVVAIALWWAIVDHGKALKKSVERLRVT